MNTTELHRTTLKGGGELFVKVDIVTYSEHHKEDGEWWYLFSRPEMCIGFMGDLVVSAKALYLEGQVQGTHQTIKVELSTQEAIEVISKNFHDLAVALYLPYVELLQGNTLVEIAKRI